MSTSSARLRTSVALSFLLALAVYVGITAYGDFSRLGSALAHFRWSLVPAILGLTLFNYLVRFIKWEYYLALLGARRAAGPARSLSLADSLNIYWAGLFMVITPGKVGEWIKSYFLREALGTPLGRSAPIIIAERLSDGLALALLSLLGLASVRQGWIWVLAFLALAAGVLAALRYGPLARGLLRLLKRAPVLRRYGEFLDQFYSSSSALFGLYPLALATALGVVSWLGEGIATYLVYVGLGVEPGWTTFAQSVFILALSTLVGSLVPLPGGLGAVDFSIAGLSRALFDLGRAPAAAASLIVRLCTLWFGVAVGAVSLAVLLRRHPSTALSEVESPR